MYEAIDMNMNNINFPLEDEEKLCEAIVSIKTVEECKKFLHDLCTPSEIEENQHL